ncbi:MAG: nucleotidyltransferase family protein [Lachnospiraceae bacterium]|nr:nucleotidyltransferase family protein [Lachnospiraceae bacterium]
MIAESLCVSAESRTEVRDKSSDDIDIHSLILLAKEESVLSIVYESLRALAIDDEDKAFMDFTNKGTVTDFWQFMFIARDTLGLLSKNGINAVILKGASVARLYPVPESRKSTDVDILLENPEDFEKADRILKNAGYVNEDHSYANHHREYYTPDKRVMELHSMAVEPTDNVKLNKYVSERFASIGSEIEKKKVLSVVLPVFTDGLQAFHLLLHMIMHFLGEGFGLKLLCDWVVFWNRKVEDGEVQKFLEDVKNCGYEKFLAVLTGVCIRYLGLGVDGTGSLTESGNYIYYSGGVFCERLSSETEDEFMREIIEGGKHKKSGTERMVALKGDGILDYIREFHHQTILSFPKAGRTIIALPVLYVIVLYRFLRNNRTVRGGQSALGILKSAGERSRLARKLF